MATAQGVLHRLITQSPDWPYEIALKRNVPGFSWRIIILNSFCPRASRGWVTGGDASLVQFQLKIVEPFLQIFLLDHSASSPFRIVVVGNGFGVTGLHCQQLLAAKNAITDELAMFLLLHWINATGQNVCSTSNQCLLREWSYTECLDNQLLRF